jgi:hypothetical protein
VRPGIGSGLVSLGRPRGGGSLTVQLPIHPGMEGAREDGEVAGVCGLRVCDGGSEALYGYLGS